MVQKITIECSTCAETEEVESRRCILIFWEKDGMGISTHDVDDKDIVDAMRRLSLQIPAHTDRSMN